MSSVVLRAGRQQASHQVSLHALGLGMSDFEDVHEIRGDLPGPEGLEEGVEDAGFADQDGLFSYIAPDKRVPANHPLRKIRELLSPPSTGPD